MCSILGIVSPVLIFISWREETIHAHKKFGRAKTRLKRNKAKHVRRKLDMQTDVYKICMTFYPIILNHEKMHKLQYLSSFCCHWIHQLTEIHTQPELVFLTEKTCFFIHGENSGAHSWWIMTTVEKWNEWCLARNQKPVELFCAKIHSGGYSALLVVTAFPEI